MTIKVGPLGAAVVCGTWLLSCGGTDGRKATTVDAGSGSPIDFAPSAIHANRSPSVCGVANPPFMNGDLFSLDIVGAATAAPYTTISLWFDSPAPSAGTPIALSVLPFTVQGLGIDTPSGSTTWYPSQRAVGDGLNFTSTQGSNPSEIDTGAFGSVVVTLMQLPAKDGDPLSARLQIHFVDGRQLDDTFSSPLATAVIGCPHP